MKLAIIVPCYNEEAVLPETTRQLSHVIRTLKDKGSIDAGYIIYVDDGSKDHTWKLIEKFVVKSECHVIGLKLSHNAGHQQALWAGLEWAALHADAAVSIDADLQDDVEAVYPMVDYYNSGMDIVYGVRKERETDSVFKKHTAQLFYRLMRKLGSEIIYNHADFRLMSQRAIRALLSFPERNLFLRGMVCTLGFPTATVYYNRKRRFAGESKYPLKKMLCFAIDGITSFSVQPLRLITYSGILFIFVAVIAIIYGLYSYAKGNAIPGWTSLLISMWFIGGAVLLACGIVGEYIGKIYKEVKRRPRYIIEKEIESHNN